LTTEFVALGNHRPSIRSEIAEVTERVRRVQLDALIARFGETGFGLDGLSPGALLFLLTGIPKLIRLEEGVGVSTTHEEVVQAFETYLQAAEAPGTGLAEPTGPARSSRRSGAGRRSTA